MSVKLALYKGQGTWANAGIRWWTSSIYSHCELVIDGWCYSSSVMDGGVRAKLIDLNPEHWDIAELPWANKAKALQWFADNAGKKYGWHDLVACQVFGLRRDYRGSFCSEAVAAALGLLNPTQFSPKTLGDECESVNKLYQEWVERLSLGQVLQTV